jgi:hypothetical protein
MPEALKHLSEIDLAKLNHSATKDSKRRDYALLGQSVLKKFDSLRFSNVTLYFSPRNDALLLEQGCDEISEMCSEVERSLDMPENFKEWEDDDHVASDDVDYYDRDLYDSDKDS